MKKLILTSLAVLALTSCGPEASQLDLQRQTAVEQFNQKTQEYESIVGTYVGRAEYKGTAFAELKLTINAVVANFPGQNQDGLWKPMLVGKAKFLGAGSGSQFTIPEINYQADINTLAMELYPDQAKSSFPARIFLKRNGNTLAGTYTPPQYMQIPGVAEDVSEFNVVLEKVVADAQQ